MACGCGCASHAPCGRPGRPNFTTLQPGQLRNTLAQLLVPVADTLRNLNTDFGLRPYVVRIIQTSWSGGRRGAGVETVKEVVQLLPTPLLTDMSALQTIVNPVGTDEQGKVKIDQISGFYTEDQLMGLTGEDNGVLGPEVTVFYEVEFVQPNGAPGIKRRFSPSGVPNYKPDAMRWWIMVDKAVENRRRNGDPGSSGSTAADTSGATAGPYAPPDLGGQGL